MSVILFVITVLTTIKDVTAKDSASRRSDDASFQSLMTLVQQQAAALQRQEASMEAMRNHISVLEHSLNSSISVQQSNSASLKALSARMGKQVAFSVTYSGWRSIDVGLRGTLKYDYVITNVGNGYTPYSGHFTAPYSGLYAFFTSLRSSNDHQWIRLAIYKGSTKLVDLTADGSADIGDRGTGYVTTHLNKGDSVYVRQLSGGTWLEAGAYTTFTGLLVAAD